MKRLLVCAALIAWSGVASAVVYKWTDAQGKILYGDRPPDGVHAEVIELLGTHVAHAPASTTASAAAPAPGGAQTPKPPPRDPAAQDDSVKKAVEDDVAQTRDKQCADAQARYKQLIEGRRLYKAGADGERQYLTSEEIDSERINAKRDVDTICNSAT